MDDQQPPPPLPPKKVAAALALGKRKRSQTPDESEAALREVWIQKLNSLLVHASGCWDSNCQYPNCAKMKALLLHWAKCKTRATGGCPICRRIWEFLEIHARQCRVPSHKKCRVPSHKKCTVPPHKKCPVPRCADLRNLFRQQAARRAKEKLLQELVKGCDEYIAGLADGADISVSDLRRAIREYLAKK